MALGLTSGPLLLKRTVIDACFMSTSRKMVVDGVSHHLSRSDEIFPKLLPVTATTGLLAPSLLGMLRVVTGEESLSWSLDTIVHSV